MKTEPLNAALQRAAESIRDAECLLIAAGAGMGVDSGLPDFRGQEGFWKAYPPIAKLKLRFEEMANPQWFDRDAALAWGFYGHRLHLYRQVQPHAGFRVLLRWANAKPAGGFVFTSNIDGHFQRAGFDSESIVECHGSLQFLQCVRPCRPDVWPSDDVQIKVDSETLRAAAPLPTCGRCGGPARPNVLMFGDDRWSDERVEAQCDRLIAWLGRMQDRRLTILEFGAGTAVPTVRRTCERLAQAHGATLVRVNPRETQTPDGQISVPLAALAALQRLDVLTSETT